MFAWMVDQNRAPQLYLRHDRLPGQVLAVLSAGQRVEKLGEHADAPVWWHVRVVLSGSPVSGYVHSGFLVETDGLAAPKTHHDVTPPACDMPPRRHRRGDRHGRAYPLDEPDMPKSPPTSADTALEILAYLDPANKSHHRYQTNGVLSYSNIFACDYCQRMGAYLPRVWWRGKALSKVANGLRVPVQYANTVDEMDTSGLHDWCEEYGVDFGWVRVFDEDALQAAANKGKAAVIVAKPKDGSQLGHISVVAPETQTVSAMRENGTVVRPVQAQAGSRNFTLKVPRTRWWLHTRFRSFGFWVQS